MVALVKILAAAAVLVAVLERQELSLAVLVEVPAVLEQVVATAVQGLILLAVRVAGLTAALEERPQVITAAVAAVAAVL